MSGVACNKHTLDAPRSDCIHCVRAQRDFYREETESMMKHLETPETKLFEDDVDPFIAKMTSRGVTLLKDPAVRYHLALLIKAIRKEGPPRRPFVAPSSPSPAKHNAARTRCYDRCDKQQLTACHLAVGQSDEDHNLWYVVKNRLGEGRSDLPITAPLKDLLVDQQRSYYAARGQDCLVYIIPAPEIPL